MIISLICRLNKRFLIGLKTLHCVLLVQAMVKIKVSLEISDQNFQETMVWAEEYLTVAHHKGVLYRWLQILQMMMMKNGKHIFRG